ncbi:MAG: oligosaccharide flippase family protein [Candidatus Dormibacteraeota bacterium]|nr:oligosaccharide flippase family protein [Candidatus Dormibacteraeota bacterium]
MSRLRRNILYNLGGQALLMGLGLLAVRFVFRQLGPDAFGIVLFSQTINAVLVAVVDLGLSSTTVREVAAHLRDEPTYVRDLIRTATLLYWTAYGLLAIGLITLAPAIVHHWIHLQSMDAQTATHLVQVLGIGSLLTLPRSLYASLLRGAQEMGLNNGIDVGMLVLQQVGMIVILIAGGGPMAVGFWLTGGFALAIVGYLLACGRLMGWRALMPGFSTEAIARNLHFSGQMAVISTTGMVQMQVDKLTVSKLLPIGDLGTYAFASTLAAGLSRVTTSIVQAAFPAFAALHADGDRPTLLRQYRRVHLLVTCLTPPFFAALTFGTTPIFAYVFDGAVARALVVPVALLCGGWFLNATLNVPYVLSLAMGRPDIVARQNLWAIVAVLPVSVLAVVLFSLRGAAFGWLFYQLFAYAYGVPRICRACLGISPIAWYRDVLRVTAVLALAYGGGYTIALTVGRGSLLWLISCYTLGSVAYLIGVYLVAGRELRDLRPSAALPAIRAA